MLLGEGEFIRAFAPSFFLLFIAKFVTLIGEIFRLSPVMTRPCIHITARMLSYILATIFLFGANSCWAEFQDTKSSLKNLLVDSTQLELSYYDHYLSDIYNTARNSNEAIEMGEKMLQIAQKKEQQHYIFKAHYHLLQFYYNQSNQAEAFRHIKEIKSLPAIDTLSEAYQSILRIEATIMMNMGEHLKAEKVINQLLSYHEGTQNYKGIALSNYLMGNHQFYQDNLSSAITYYEKAKDAYEKNGDRVGAIRSYDALGYVYFTLGKMEQSIAYSQRALAEIKQFNKPYLNGNILINLSEKYIALKEYNKAIPYLQKAKSIADSIDHDLLKIDATRQLGIIYAAQNKIDLAEKNFLESKKVALNGNYRDRLERLFRTMQQFYLEQDQYTKAYKYLELATQLKDTIINTENLKQLNYYRTSFEFQEKNAENAALALALQKKQNQNFLLLFTAIAALFLLIWAISSNNQKIQYNKALEVTVHNKTSELQLINQQLLESNQELEKFAHIASHDLKEPLRNIISFIKLLQKRLPDKISAENKDYLSFVSNSAFQMYHLVENILEYSSLENRPIHLERVDIARVIQEITALLQISLNEKGAVVYVATPLVPILSNYSQLFVLFKNLIENALKYNNSDQPQIAIFYQELDNQHQFAVKDNGIGIAPEFHHQIFKMFKRLHNRSQFKGSGMGLAICAKIVRKLRGKIWVESLENRGSTFYFSLPKLPLSNSSDTSNTANHQEVK